MGIRVFATASLVSWSACAFAQPEASPNARAILRECAAALQQAKGLSYKAVMGSGGDRSVPVPESSGEVLLAKAENEAGFIVKVTGRLLSQATGQTTTCAASNDGESIVMIDHDARSYSKVEADRMTMGLMPGLDLLIMEFAFADLSPMDGPEIIAARVVGREVIEEVDCHIVEVEIKAPEGSGQPPMSMRRAIGTADHLIRRVEWPIADGLGEGKPSIVMTYAAVKALAEAPAKEAFAIAKPEGYAEVEMPGLDSLPRPKYKVGDEAGDWTLTSAEGKEFKLSELRGKIVLMDFWATWCGPCTMAMPGLQKLHEKYKDKGVLVLGVNVFDEGDAVAYMKDQGYGYTTLLKGDEVARDYGVQSIPQFYLIGPDGKVLHHSVGFDPKGEEKLAKVIDENLNRVQR